MCAQAHGYENKCGPACTCHNEHIITFIFEPRGTKTKDKPLVLLCALGDLPMGSAPKDLSYIISNTGRKKTKCTFLRTKGTGLIKELLGKKKRKKKK